MIRKWYGITGAGGHGCYRILSLSSCGRSQQLDSIGSTFSSEWTFGASSDSSRRRCRAATAAQGYGTYIHPP